MRAAFWTVIRIRARRLSRRAFCFSAGAGDDRAGLFALADGGGVASAVGAWALPLLGPMTTATLALALLFRRRDRLALGIAAIATSGGGFVVVLLLASHAIDHYGWRNALLGEAASWCS